MTELIKTAPEKIYLCVSDDESHHDEAFPYGAEVCWAEDRATGVTVEYVRQDKALDDETRRMVLELCEKIQRTELSSMSMIDLAQDIEIKLGAE